MYKKFILLCLIIHTHCMSSGMYHSFKNLSFTSKALVIFGGYCAAHYLLEKICYSTHLINGRPIRVIRFKDSNTKNTAVQYSKIKTLLLTEAAIIAGMTIGVGAYHYFLHST